MGHWNHRVVRKKYPEAALAEDRVFYQIHEAYYDDDGVCYGITQEPTRLMERNVTELRSTLEKVERALKTPVLDYNTREEI